MSPSSWSLPLRKCGLKYLIESICIDWYSVTSLAEVWIEISQSFRHIHPVHVTSLAEVWIEIASWLALSASATSLPLRKCGLKYDRNEGCNQWGQSLPLRKCGLKSAFSSAKKERERSLPLRKCGLKLCIQWSNGQALCHFPCGSVDWNYAGRIIISNPLSHFPCGSVDWNLRGGWSGLIVVGHFPCGSVDWNSIRIPFTVYSWPSLPSRKCGLKYWAVLHMGIRGVSAIIINIIKTYWNPWICLIFIFTSWEIPMQPFCWRIVLIQKVFRICRTCQGNYIRRCLWRYTGNYRRLSGRTGTIYWRSYSKREERSVLWLFRNDWNRLNSGGIFQRSMMKNRIVVIEKSTNKNRTFVLFSCVNLYTFKNLFDIIGTVTRTNSKKYDRTGG